MTKQAELNENLKQGLCPEFKATVDKMEYIMVNPGDEKYAHEKIYGKLLKCAHDLRNFGDMGVVNSIISIK